MSLTLCVRPGSEPTKLLDDPKQNLVWGPQTDKHLTQSPFTGKFFLDDDVLLWRLYCSLADGLMF
jgi:hypothetical protein